MPLAMFVFPARDGRGAARGRSPATRSCRAAPLTMDPAAIDANREGWIDEWTDIVLR